MSSFTVANPLTAAYKEECRRWANIKVRKPKRKITINSHYKNKKRRAAKRAAKQERKAARLSNVCK